MEDVKEAMSLLSEQETARRCGVSRISLLRARKAGKSDTTASEPAFCFLELR